MTNIQDRTEPQGDRTERPTHPWFDPDADGHDCVLCPDDSIWKCDQAAHEGAKLHEWLLTPDERQSLNERLAEIARARVMAPTDMRLA